MTTRATTAMTARDVMTPDPVTVTADTTLRELARILEANEISGVPVVDAQERVVGIVSKTDLLHRCIEGPPGSTRGTFFEILAEGLPLGTDLEAEDVGTVEDLMNPEPVTARLDEPVAALAGRMVEESIHRVVVTDERQHVLGIVTSLDMLKVLARS